ncbi:MAG: hypothetical protein KAX33_11745, partial [Candidatus Lokiarchaeota archaeon]|nr:hypothetical protein [Candidatus Lokiarchaeota archaeon]
MEYEKNRQRFRKVGLIHLIFVLILIASAFLPYYGVYDYYNEYYYYEFGYSVLLYGGWEGLFFIILSIIFAYFSKVNKAIVSGVIGCILITIPLLIYFFFDLQIGKILGLISLIGFCSVTVSLYKFRPQRQDIQKIQQLEQQQLQPQQQLQQQQ